MVRTPVSEVRVIRAPPIAACIGSSTRPVIVLASSVGDSDCPRAKELDTKRNDKATSSAGQRSRNICVLLGLLSLTQKMRLNLISSKLISDLIGRSSDKPGALVRSAFQKRFETRG